MLLNTFGYRDNKRVVMSLQMIIYAKQNGAQMANFAAAGTRADIDDLRKTMAALGTKLHPIRIHLLSESKYGLRTVSLDAKRRRSRISLLPF